MSRDLSVAVVGAGIGGLALASCLRRFGMEAHLYEQAKGFARIGAGLQMTPNAMKVLRGLGLEEQLRAAAFLPERAFNRDHDSGAISNELTLGATSEQRFGAPYLLMHRGDLHRALEGLIPDSIVDLGRKLARYEQDPEGVTLHFGDGSATRADIAIAADGVHSVAREQMLGAENPRFTGKVAYRTTFPAALLRGGPPIAGRTKWWGPDRHIVIYPITRNADEIYFVTSQPEGAEWMTPESWSAKGDLNELRKAFAAFHPEVQTVLAACPEVYKWALLEREPLATWVDGRVALLGDACHPMTPYMAQGAASALEDAVILARVLAEADAGSHASLNTALRRYEALRKPRASAIQGTSRNNTWMRDATDPTWVYGHDAWSEPLPQ